MSIAVSCINNKSFDHTPESATNKLSLDPPVAPSLPNPLTLTEKISRIVYGILGFGSSYHLLDNGLAHFLGIDVLKHGTNIVSYTNISLNGADPSKGGANEAIYWPKMAELHHCKGKFFVMPNSDVGFVQEEAVNWTKKFSYWATINLVGGEMEGERKRSSFSAQLLTFLTPVLRFKFRPEEVKAPRFEPDTALSPAMFTRHSINPIRLGVCGSLTQGIGLGMFGRMTRDPLKLVYGALLLGASAYIAKRTYNYIKGEPIKKTKEVSCESAIQSNVTLSSCKKIRSICGALIGLYFRGYVARQLSTW